MTTLPVLQAFEKDLTKIVFTINRVSAQLTAVGGGTGSLTANSGTAIPAGGTTGNRVCCSRPRRISGFSSGPARRR